MLIAKLLIPGLVSAVLVTVSGFAVAKLPALDDQAKARAAEAAAKTAWAGKVDTYQLCKSQDKVAATYLQKVKSSGKEAKVPVTTPLCADPGTFAYTAPAPEAVKPIEAAGAHSPAATAASPPSGKQTDAVVNPAKKP